jgi:hypothetical protein
LEPFLGFNVAGIVSLGFAGANRNTTGKACSEFGTKSIHSKELTFTKIALWSFNFVFLFNLSFKILHFSPYHLLTFKVSV